MVTKMSKQQPDESVSVGDVNAGSANPASTPSFLLKINKEKLGIVDFSHGQYCKARTSEICIINTLSCGLFTSQHH